MVALQHEIPSACFSIEIKDSPLTVRPVLTLISSLGLDDQVVIASFYDNVLVKVRTEAPRLLTTMSLGEMAERAIPSGERARGDTCRRTP